jgi:hypothetical protein
MSATDLTSSLSTPTQSTSSAPSRPVARAGAGRWTRVAVACAILLASAGVRWWQVRRIERELTEGRVRPRIDLARLPMLMGPWKGESTALDPLIARATGADQIVTRRYVNQDTGVALDVILLYGPAVEMFIHSPEVCYPTAGFTLAAGPDARQVPAGPAKMTFRSLVYTKGEGAATDLQEVYFSWRYNNKWSPDVGKQKHFERIPSMYKVQVARRVSDHERRDVGNPCEAFLQELLPDLEQRISATRGRAS